MTDEEKGAADWIEYVRKQSEVQAKMLELVAALVAPKSDEEGRFLEVWRQAYNAAVPFNGGTPAKLIEMADCALAAYKAKAAELAGKK